MLASTTTAAPCAGAHQKRRAGALLTAGVANYCEGFLILIAPAECVPNFRAVGGFPAVTSRRASPA